MKSFTSMLAMALSVAAVATAVSVPDACLSGTSELVNSTMIDGQALTVHKCKVEPKVSAPADAVPHSALVRRDYGLCGAPCTTYCNAGSNGPNPNDCSTLASQSAENGGFTVDSGYAVYWTYSSCQVYQNNQLNPAQDIGYCYDYNNWAGVVNYLAWNCQGTTGDQGGSCHFYDSTDISWIQVQHS